MSEREDLPPESGNSHDNNSADQDHSSNRNDNGKEDWKGESRFGTIVQGDGDDQLSLDPKNKLS